MSPGLWSSAPVPKALLALSHTMPVSWLPSALIGILRFSLCWFSGAACWTFRFAAALRTHPVPSLQFLLPACSLHCQTETTMGYCLHLPHLFAVVVAVFAQPNWKKIISPAFCMPQQHNNTRIGIGKFMHSLVIKNKHVLLICACADSFTHFCNCVLLKKERINKLLKPYRYITYL